MTISRILMFTAAIAVATAQPAFAQGRGAVQRPAKVTTAKTPNGAATAKPAGTPRASKPVEAGATRRVEGGKPDAGAQGPSEANRADRTFVDRIADQPQQRARLEAMLPPGMTLEQAASGFRNQGQFIAALEASSNQNIPFASLKTEMTGSSQLSLGEAIQKLKPATSGTTP